MIRRLYVLIIVFVVTLGGCSSSRNIDGGSISIWHWMGDRVDAFDKLAADYEKLTGTRIHFELYAPSEVYSQKIKAAAQTNTLPDIFGILGDTRDFASFVKSGFVADVGSLLGGTNESEWRETFFSKALAVNQFEEGNAYGVKPGLYGVPLDMTNVQLLYNKDLLRKAGLDPEDPPRTWEEFIQIGRQLRAKGIPVLVGGFGEIWLIDIMATGFAMSTMGEDKVYRTYKGEISYTDPDWIRVLEMFKSMADEGLLVSGTVTMVNKSAEQAFANGHATFAWNGSWCVNVYKGMNPKLDYAAVLPPRVLGTSQHPMRIWGGAGNSLMVNDRSSKKKGAMDFLKWLSQKEQQIYFANVTNNLPANREAIGNLSPILAQFADDLDNTFHLNTMPVHENYRVMEAWDKGIQSIMIGEKTPLQVAEEVQAIKERQMKKAGL